METSKLYTWAISARVLNEQRMTLCSQTGAFLHSEGTVTFELAQTREPACLLHAKHPEAYRYVPRDRVDALLRQAAEARDRWTTQLIIHKGRPPVEQWTQYQGGLRHLAGEVTNVLSDLRVALPVLQAADPDGSAAGEYAAIAGQLSELLGVVDGAVTARVETL
jgi:hypothetical protein